MRILIASDSYPPKIDGVSDTATLLTRELSARGHRVLVAAPGPGEPSMGGAEVLRCPSLPLPLYPELRVAVAPRVAAAVRKFNPQAVIAMTPGPVGVAAMRAAPSTARVLHIYTTDIPGYLRAYRLGALAWPVDRLLRWMSNRATATLCPTQRVLRDLQARGHQRLEVWGRGVDTELFRPSRRTGEMRWRLTGGEPDRPLVLYVGRLAREKRLTDLYRAAVQMPGVRFALVGDGPQRDQLERQFASVRSVFTGYLRGTALAEAFASADVFAFPSDTDTFGQVVIQAMASGVPPVVAAGSAPAELVCPGVAGLHAPPRDARALAAALRRLTLDKDLRGALAHGALMQSANFSWERLVDRLEQLMAGQPGTEAR